MDFQKDYQYHFQTISQDSFVTEYIIPPIILFLLIILVYSYIKKKLLRDDKEDLESLKLLQELLDLGTINENEFEKKKILTLEELYENIIEILPNEDEKIVKHRIRAVLNSLRIKGEVERIENRTWKKLG